MYFGGVESRNERRLAPEAKQCENRHDRSKSCQFAFLTHNYNQPPDDDAGRPIRNRR